MHGPHAAAMLGRMHSALNARLHRSLSQHHHLRLHRLLRGLLCVSAAGLQLACGGTSPTAQAETSSTASAAAATADVKVLMLGNSHTAGADLPSQLAAMLRAALPGRSVAVVVAPGYLFLEERLHDPGTVALLQSQPWHAVVLQAQKYSSSGLYSHSTAEAEELVRRVSAARAAPVMFPEWGRRGIEETPRIWALHAGIAARAPACVAPVPQAWDLALQRHPALALHASDGNHAEASGAFLAALVLHSTLTGLSPLALPDLPGPVPADVQGLLRHAAADAALQQPPRALCPADARPLQ